MAVTHLSALAVERYCEAVRLVADELNQVQYWRVAGKDYGFVFLSVDVDDFFFLGDRGQRKIGDLQ